MFILLSIFSSFDIMSTFYGFHVFGCILVITTKSFWLKFFKNNKFFFFPSFVVISDLKSLSLNIFFLKLANYMSVVFTFVWLINFLGLLPYVFSFSSHMMMSFSYVLMFWLSLMVFTFFNNLKNFLVHLLPVSTPGFLCVFMILIEIISQLIRPITLSVRLAANMTAGHILLILLSSMMVFVNFKFLAFMVLIILEMAVVFIQAYVFCVLLTMYILETN